MKIFDEQFSHASSAGTPYQDTILPFAWERNFSEIKPDEVIIFTESGYYNSKNINNKNKILWILESPSFVDQKIIDDILVNYKDFKKILTHDERLLSLPNSILFPIGGCWIKNGDEQVYNKTKLVSTIASNKKFTLGQSIRHLIANNPKVSSYGPAYKPIDYKLEALKDYQFHICIENHKNDFYFTEKIIDCFATGTIPIYWGGNKISNFFNTNGIIEVDDINELNYVIDHLHEFDICQDVLNENFILSKQYWIPEDRIATINV